MEIINAFTVFKFSNFHFQIIPKPDQSTQFPLITKKWKLHRTKIIKIPSDLIIFFNKTHLKNILVPNQKNDRLNQEFVSQEKDVFVIVQNDRNIELTNNLKKWEGKRVNNFISFQQLYQ